MLNAQSKLIDTQEQSVDRDEGDVAAEQHKILLVAFANAVVNPWAVRQRLILHSINA